MTLTISELKKRYSGDGTVEEILVRAAKHEQPFKVQSVQVTKASGIQGDHYSANSRKRQVTLIQYEHLPVLASLMQINSIDAALLRRNIVISGINLLTLKDCVFSVGTVHLKMTGLCHPCSRMEKALGPGGYNAMRGHGGINATVIQDGKVSVGDRLSIVKFIQE